MIRINNTQYVHFLEQADALRRSGMMCDAVISVRNQIFRAHRLVLACASRRLAEKLALGGNEGPVRCTLESFSPRTFKQVLDFTYKQALEVTLDDLQLLLRAAEVLEIQPLEEQCRTQLEIIHCKNGEVDRTREGSGKISEQKLREGPVQDEKLGPSVGEESDSIVIEDNSPVDPVKTPDSPQPPMKKARTPSSSVTQFDRVSVISRHAGSSAAFSCPWTFPSSLKTVATLKRVADYTGFIPFHPVQHHDQSAVPYSFSSTTPHVLPLLAPHFQSSVVAYSDLNSAYAQGFYARSEGIESIIKQGLLKRKGRSFQSSESSNTDGPESSTDSPGERHQRSKCPYDEPGLRNTSSATSDESCGGSCFKGAGDVTQQQSRQQGHKAGKPHQCQHCPKKFSLKHQLDTHLRVHTAAH
ncbi:zinc finger and BTB domain-containing protein 16-A isoform X2 [Takifugu rubripes]|uniref:zinc finger and BTB domain-containing protein 16-A isoform X2 n=1 Tax=Takifugu rubripes TaxID=31033 RepID=UPI0005D17A2F|nr:zinc finger and BTB domain-containing protein 32 isoform X2 [Takifugu rubripes]|eukprot:XP_011603902.1 PREDICTED: zinc finger and BTB domain-containing protein 32 isoform X2 [Takifugu rubripes]